MCTLYGSVLSSGVTSGPELLEVETPQGPRLLYEWVAERLAEKLAVDTEGLARPLTLNDVICSFLAARGRREEAYARVRSILRDAEFAPPVALSRLASINAMVVNCRASSTSST